MRLASLYGPDAIAQSPRATRFVTNADVRVVVGLAPLTRAIAEIERLPDTARTPGIAASYDEITDMVNPSVSAETRSAPRARHVVEDGGSQRHRAAGSPHPPRKRRRSSARSSRSRKATRWALAVVRRMQRHQVDETTVGIEIVGRRLVRVLLRNWVTPSDAGRAGADKPFFGIYLPAHPENRQMAQRSLIGPDERFVTGGMVELDTGSARYLIRFTQTLERQPGWAWTLFSAVRKLLALRNWDRIPAQQANGGPDQSARCRDHGPREAGSLSEPSASPTSFQRGEIMERRSFLKHTGLAGILAAGSAPAIRADARRSQVAARVELSEEPRHDLRRRGNDLRSASPRSTNNKFQIQVFAAGEIVPAVRRGRCRAERHGPVLPHGAVLFLRQGSDVRVRAARFRSA